MADETNTLIVRHLPSVLNTEEQEDLLKHFGAAHVRPMGSKGRMKHVAFAAFADHEEASKALSRLHQLEVLGSKLVVEFSKSQYQKFHPSVMGHKKLESDVKEKQKVEEGHTTLNNDKQKQQ